LDQPRAISAAETDDLVDSTRTLCDLGKHPRNLFIGASPSIRILGDRTGGFSTRRSLGRTMDQSAAAAPGAYLHVFGVGPGRHALRHATDRLRDARGFLPAREPGEYSGVAATWVRSVVW